ncbi:MAG: hypothetical protein K0V04_29590 [Deltaproteobacteria bacterium]|nr:hypothetical protein [Deltaproteobacteria bacterium]
MTNETRDTPKTNKKNKLADLFINDLGKVVGGAPSSTNYYHEETTTFARGEESGLG